MGVKLIHDCLSLIIIKHSSNILLSTIKFLLTNNIMKTVFVAGHVKIILEMFNNVYASHQSFGDVRNTNSFSTD